MPRWLAALLLVVLLPWQSLAWAADATRTGPQQEESHVVAHWLGEAHHHDDDGGFHEEDSDEASRHLHADSCLNCASVLPAPLTWTPGTLSSSGPPEFGSTLAPPPFLEGPHRPPRFHG